MRYLRIETLRDTTDPPAIPTLTRLAARALESLLPHANPDLHPLLADVCVWWLEIEDTGEPTREIGFSAAGAPIVLCPVGSNTGVLVDAADDWSTSTADSAEAAARFEATWSALWPHFAHLDDRGSP
jgi:hypothetical protein